MLNSQETRICKASYDRLKSRKSHFNNTGKILLKQEFSDGLQISMNIKDITIPLIIHYYLPEHSEHYTNLSTLNHNVRFQLHSSAPGRWHNAIRVRAKPCVHRFNYSRTLPQRSSRQGWT